MVTIIQSVARPAKRGPYRIHTVEFKRAIVKRTLADGASISLMAREYNVNTNQLFGWRKLCIEGKLGDAADGPCAASGSAAATTCSPVPTAVATVLRPFTRRSERQN